MKIRLYLAISASALALQCGSAQAQDYYVGLGLSATDGTGKTNGFNSAGDISWNNASIFAGVRFNRSTPLFYGAEIETSLGGFSNETQSGGFLGKVNPDRVNRLRAIVGYKYEKLSVFGALGAVQMDATNFGYGGDANGVTFGLGVEIPVSSRIDIRLEAIHDKMDAAGNGYTQDYSNNSIRIGAMMKF